MAVRTKAEVLHGFPGILRSTEEKRIRSSRSPKSELVQSQRLTARLFNPGPRSGGKAKGGNRELRNGQKAVVICHGTDNNHSLALVGFSRVGDDSREGDRRTVDSGHKKAAKHNLVETRIGAACKHAKSAFRVRYILTHCWAVEDFLEK